MMPILPPLLTLLLRAFIAISERVFLNWYDGAKDRMKAKAVKDVQTEINSDPDPVIDDKLRKWQRD